MPEVVEKQTTTGRWGCKNPHCSITRHQFFMEALSCGCNERFGKCDIHDVVRTLTGGGMDGITLSDLERAEEEPTLHGLRRIILAQFVSYGKSALNQKCVQGEIDALARLEASLNPTVHSRIRNLLWEAIEMTKLHLIDISKPKK